MRDTKRPYQWQQLWRKRLKGYVERKPILALSGDEETVMDPRRGAERDSGRPILVANLLLANLLTQECFLAELGLKAEIQTWVTHLNSRLKWPPSYNVHPKLPRRIAKGISLEPPISQPTEWVVERAETCDIPNWYVELSTVPLEDTKKVGKAGESLIQTP